MKKIVLRLRQKIEPESGNPAMIRSVRGFGYSFNENVEQQSAVSAR